jgi:hypothetical protein
MTPERYQRLCELFDQAQARPTEQRAAFLQEVGAADPTLRAELESMLSDDRQARGEHFLQAPPPVNARAVLPPDGVPPTGRAVRLLVIIHFPWDPAAEKFGGERVYFDRAALSGTLRVPGP